MKKIASMYLSMALLVCCCVSPAEALAPPIIKDVFSVDELIEWLETEDIRAYSGQYRDGILSLRKRGEVLLLAAPMINQMSRIEILPDKYLFLDDNIILRFYLPGDFSVLITEITQPYAQQAESGLLDYIESKYAGLYEIPVKKA